MTSSVGEILRHEKAILKPESSFIESGYGGTLTLTEDRLTWKASRWRLFQFISQRGIRALGGHAPPRLLEINLREAEFAVGSPQRPWLAFIIFPVMILLELVSGGSRKTLEMYTPYMTPAKLYYFAVKDAAAWLEDIGRVRGDGRAHKPWAQGGREPGFT